MKWECEKCVHKSVCDEWGEQEGVAACSYGDYFQENILVGDLDRGAWECPHCEPDTEGYVRKFGAYSVHDAMLETGHCKPQEIKYCPRCGRPLTEAAWAELEKRLRRSAEGGSI